MRIDKQGDIILRKRSDRWRLQSRREEQKASPPDDRMKKSLGGFTNGKNYELNEENLDQVSGGIAGFIPYVDPDTEGQGIFL